jgi:hypothetical protein
LKIGDSGYFWCEIACFEVQVTAFKMQKKNKKAMRAKINAKNQTLI